MDCSPRFLIAERVAELGYLTAAARRAVAELRLGGGIGVCASATRGLRPCGTSMFFWKQLYGGHRHVLRRRWGKLPGSSQAGALVWRHGGRAPAATPTAPVPLQNCKLSCGGQMGASGYGLRPRELQS